MRLSAFVLQPGRDRDEQKSRGRQGRGGYALAILPGDEAKRAPDLDDNLIDQPVLNGVTDDLGIGFQIHLLQQTVAVGAYGLGT